MMHEIPSLDETSNEAVSLPGVKLIYFSLIGSLIVFIATQSINYFLSLNLHKTVAKQNLAYGLDILAFVVLSLCTILIICGLVLYFLHAKDDEQAFVGIAISLFLIGTAGFVLRSTLVEFFSPGKESVLTITTQIIQECTLCLALLFFSIALQKAGNHRCIKDIATNARTVQFLAAATIVLGVLKALQSVLVTAGNPDLQQSNSTNSVLQYCWIGCLLMLIVTVLTMLQSVIQWSKSHPTETEF